MVADRQGGDALVATTSLTGLLAAFVARQSDIAVANATARGARI
jgi:hypothetical protein